MIKRAILITLMICLAVVLGNDYYTIIHTAQHNWAWYMSNRESMGIELFSISFLLVGLMLGLLIV